MLILSSTLFSLPMISVGLEHRSDDGDNMYLSGGYIRDNLIGYYGSIYLPDFSDSADKMKLSAGIDWRYRYIRELSLGIDAGYLYDLHESDGHSSPFLGLFGEYFIKPDISFDISVRYLTESHITLSAGIVYTIGFSDGDNDWVRDEFDRCPRTPVNAHVDRRGCGYDSDGDGVFDGIDKCPETPLLAFVDSCGCPFDTDGDGVFDGVDRCPDTPAGIPIDSTGCPSDSDNDGVPDFNDECPDTPLGAEVDSKGCPKDSDEDGVYDGIDLCPGTPTGFEVDRFGCPQVTPIDTLVIDDLFDKSLNLKGVAVGKLETAAKRIRAYPDKIYDINGYTDNEGSPQFNYNRSSTVLNKVKEILLARGVLENQIILKPMGEKNAVASNATAEGVQSNRRIEIIRFVEE